MSAPEAKERPGAAILAGDLADVAALAAQNAQAVPAYVLRQVAEWEQAAREAGGYDPAVTSLIEAAHRHRTAKDYRTRAENLRRAFPDLFTGTHALQNEAERLD